MMQNPGQGGKIHEPLYLPAFRFSFSLALATLWLLGCSAAEREEVQEERFIDLTLQYEEQIREYESKFA